METQSKKKFEVYHALRHRLIYLYYKPGEIINEKDLCAEFKIGRTPLRDIFMRLQHDRLVKILPRFGTFAEDIDLRELKNLYVVREALEGLNIHIAVGYMQDEHIEFLGQVIEDIKIAREGKDYQELAHLDELFHNTLQRLSHNRPLQEILYNLNDRCVRGWYAHADALGQIGESMQNLTEVYEAIKERDQDKARKEMEQHINSFYQLILRVL